VSHGKEQKQTIPENRTRFWPKNTNRGGRGGGGGDPQQKKKKAALRVRGGDSLRWERVSGTPGPKKKEKGPALGPRRPRKVGDKCGLWTSEGRGPMLLQKGKTDVVRQPTVGRKAGGTEGPEAKTCN